MKKYQIIKANPSMAKDIVKFIDLTFTKEGYGFVTSAQINTETKRGAVWVALNDNHIVGARIGLNRVYNLAVHPNYRGQGIGRQLIETHPPDTIRVKAIPVGHLSKSQIENFTTPVGFYDAIGYEYDHSDYARNFWQRGKAKAFFHKVGRVKHIQIFRRKGCPKQAIMKLGNEVESDITLDSKTTLLLTNDKE